jgi:hypothetical protein
MNSHSRLIAVLVSVSLLGGSGVLARVAVFGVVTQAHRATLSSGIVSAGASLYDGDTLATDVDGALTLRAAASMIHLGGQSRATLWAPAGIAKYAQLDLGAGTVIFSIPQAAAIEIRADGASIRAAAEASTFGQITIINASAFEIYARRGALNIQYRDETEAIAEGASYRVILDASNNDDSSAKSTPSEKPKPVKATSHKRKRIVLTAIGGTAAGAASAIPMAVLNDYESPDHP